MRFDDAPGGHRGPGGRFSDRLSSRLDTAPAPSEGLRDRKKRLMRQLISDTATAMFLNRGFDDVRVAEVAAACEVSEKTVYNYFPTKEALLLDREEPMTAAIQRMLGPGTPTTSPIDAALRMISDDLHRLYHRGTDDDDPVDVTAVRRFGDLIEGTPSLRAARRDMMDRLVAVAAEAMAARAQMSADDPEPQIAAHALLGLWRVEFNAMYRYSDGTLTPREIVDRVLADVRRAARLIDTGLWSFGLIVQGANGREQLRLAAETANDARKQVVRAISQARRAWQQVVAESHRADIDLRTAANHWTRDGVRSKGRGRAGDRRGRSNGSK